MAHSYLIFDFGDDEATAQQARQKLESWKRAFRLGEKLQLKFDRGEATQPDGAADGKKAAGKRAAKDSAGERIRVVVRLDFSDHEKLSHQRWLDRIPAETPFKSASPRVVQALDAGHAEAEKLFDSLAGEFRAARE